MEGQLNNMEHVVVKKKINVCIVGASGVGKTQLLNRYTGKGFVRDEIATHGINIVLKNSFEVRFQIFDTSGQKKNEMIQLNYLKKAKRAIFVYSLTDLDSFERMQNLLITYLSFSKDKVKANLLESSTTDFVIIATKSDLGHENEMEDMGKKLAREHGCEFFVTSALLNKNIESVFRKLEEGLFSERFLSTVISRHSSVVQSWCSKLCIFLNCH